MNSVTNSEITIFQTVSQFKNSEIETPDEFADSEPSPSTYTQISSSTHSKPHSNLKPTVHPPPLLLTFPKLPQPTPHSFPNDQPTIPQIIFNFPKI